MTLNAGKWASVAKENVVKMSSTAAQQASELTKNVNEKINEGGLLGTLSSGVSNVSSKLGNVSSKAFSGLNSYWSGGYGSEMNSSNSTSLTGSTSFAGFFQRSGYNSMEGDRYNQDTGGGNSNQGGYNNEYTSYNDTAAVAASINRSNSASNFAANNNKDSSSSNRSSKKKDDWDWEDDQWESAGSGPAKSTAAKPASTKDKSSKPAKDLMAFDDDNWEPLEPASKNK